jgi:hypothetical protein
VLRSGWLASGEQRARRLATLLTVHTLLAAHALLDAHADEQRAWRAVCAHCAADRVRGEQCCAASLALRSALRW